MTKQEALIYIEERTTQLSGLKRYRTPEDYTYKDLEAILVLCSYLSVESIKELLTYSDQTYQTMQEILENKEFYND